MRQGRLIEHPFLRATVVLVAAAMAVKGSEPLEKVVRLQPIQVCSDDGSFCANVDRELFAEVTTKVWAQAGIRVEFLPWTNFLGSVWLDLDTSLFSDYSIFSLSQAVGNGRHPDPTVVNVWFVRSFSNGAYGHSWQNVPAHRNGIAIADLAFSGAGRLDVVAHELGHNLGLDHANLGAGSLDNLMSSPREVPASVDEVYPDGARLDILTAEQIERALSSPFVIPAESPWIQRHPASRSVIPGASVSFGVEAAGPNLHYQWQFDGEDLLGEVAPTLSIASVTAAHVGSYRVVVSNEYGRVMSSDAVLKLNLYEPVPGIDSFDRFMWERVELPVGELLANDLDQDGDDLQVVLVDVESSEGGGVTFQDGWISYRPPPGFWGADSFGYLISDSAHLVWGTVQIQVKPDLPIAEPTSIEISDGGRVRLAFRGIPELDYRVEFKVSLADPEWTSLTNLTADETGLFELVDRVPEVGGTGFYRSVWP